MRRRLRSARNGAGSRTTLKTIGVVAAVGAAILGMLNVPDLVRYLRMRRM